MYLHNIRIQTYRVHVISKCHIDNSQTNLTQLNGFYRGMSFPLFLGGALNSILFGVYGYEVRRLQSTCESESGKRKNRQIHTFIAGSMAGLIHSFVACPLELIKIRLQTQNCKSFCFLPQAASLCMFIHYFFSMVESFFITLLYLFVLLILCQFLRHTD